MKNKLHTKMKSLLILLCLFFTGTGNLLFAQNFKQVLRWNADPSVLEYKVEIQDNAGRSIQSTTTENNYLDLSLKEGSYKYKITAYDLLGRESVSTNWISFEVAVAKQPEISHSRNLEALGEDGKSLELDVSVDDVTSDTVAQLVNVKDGSVISGQLILDGASSSTVSGLTISETHHASKARFYDVPEGHWKLVIKNPSGYSTESDAFEVRDIIKEQKLAAEKAEQERLAREKAEAEERARLEAERLAREEAERKEREEAERLAKEEADRLERERQEAERLALEEERSRLEEEERLALEAEEAEEAEAEEESEEDELDSKEARRQKWLTYDRKFYLIAGAGVSMPLYDSGFFNEAMENGPRIPLLFTAQIGFLPLHTELFRFGMELNTFGTQYKRDNEFYKFYLNILGLQDNLAVRLGLPNKKVWFQLKAGGGLTIVQENLDILEEGAGAKEDKVQNFGYPSAGGGLSVIFTPTAMLMLELGADFYNLFIPDTNIGLLYPYLGVGLRF